MQRERTIPWWKSLSWLYWIASIGIPLIIYWLSAYQFEVLDKINLKKNGLDISAFFIAYLAFLFSIYQTAVYPFAHKPRLCIGKSGISQWSDPTDEERKKAKEEKREETASNFLRIKVSNLGQLTAKNCVGRLIEVQDKNEERIDLFDPIDLYWARQNSLNPFKPVDIQGENDSTYLDVVQIKENSSEFCLRVVIPENQRLPLNRKKYPTYENSHQGKLPKGEYFLLIGIYAENAYVKPTRFKLWWDESDKPTLELTKKR